MMVLQGSDVPELSLSLPHCQHANFKRLIEDAIYDQRENHAAWARPETVQATKVLK